MTRAWLLSPEFVGRPLGDPFDQTRQKTILKQALALLESASKNGTVLDLDQNLAP